MAKTGEALQARWLDFPGEQLVSQVEVEVGGQRIDRQYGDWMHIWNQLTMTAEQQRGYHKNDWPHHSAHVPHQRVLQRC